MATPVQGSRATWRRDRAATQLRHLDDELVLTALRLRDAGEDRMAASLDRMRVSVARKLRELKEVPDGTPIHSDAVEAR
jgi:hypothetical protein